MRKLADPSRREYDAGVDKIIAHWLERAEYDLETARSLLRSKRYLYVAFMCQQTVEKLLKGYIAALGKSPPPVHNLARLAADAELTGTLPPEHRLLLADVHPYYIKARYGEYKDALAKVCTAEKAAHFLQATEELTQWLRSQPLLKRL